ncbi:hypothetical protein E4U13_003133 [Claviceps humidiphila]|uniref:Uncharacterized protein n=2 Tax=Claviceps TaxID=5110 RepID=A0A9P7MXA7_9HYPO|nr:hypothetical protein E4U57_004408 [Claviceps arundinis]KAG5974396.1 hypothetical protein E4U56_004723 [Claviceps arundinis]KAG6114849.1 hypothetical protein E4U13_003133 [Claviceps humidiphila]
MRSSHHLSVLLLAGSVAAMPRHECISTHGHVLAASTDCGDAMIVEHCFAALSRFDQSDLRDCFVMAGCPAYQADLQAESVIRRCSIMEAQVQDLKIRQPANKPSAPSPTLPGQVMPRDTASPAPTPAPTGNSNKFGEACFKTGTTSTLTCNNQVVDGHLKSQECHHVPVTTSDCLHGYICTMDSNHQDVCMQAHNSLDTGGIVIAVIFGSFIVLGLGYIIFACCQERKQNKQIAKKVEATALARAATMKQRAQDVRAPLIEQTHDNGAGPNPFHDPARHA